MNGGYILIDCTGLDLTKGSTKQTITGIYKKVADCIQKNKPLYCVNAVWGDLGGVSPIQIFAIQSASDTITVTVSTLQVVVKNDDTITIENMVETE